MLSVEENQRFTQTGKGTLMGELLRRYWHPIAALTEFESRSTKPVRLLGEDLVLYRDKSGTFGLLGLHCPHRRADLSYGYVEECGLRCSYHGWAFDETGACISAPFEDTVSGNTRFRDAIRHTAYRVDIQAGMIFAYIGPEPAPVNPIWETFQWSNGFAQIVFSELPCNWLQSQENSIDPVHFEWLHNNWSARQAGKDDFFAPTHLKIEFDEFDHGFGYKRILQNSDEADDGWAFPRMCILPNLFCPGASHFEYKVPVDDTNTLHVTWNWDPVPAESRPYRQDRIPHWYAPTHDPATGRWITSHVVNQDTVAWVGQGVITDRDQEHLGRSDIGVVRLRRQLELDAQAVAEGRDPKGTIRDPDKAVVTWPFAPWRERFTEPLARAAMLDRLRRMGVLGGDYFAFYAGQPAEVREEFCAAMGFPP